MYKKTQPKIRYGDFLKLANEVNSFKSVRGHKYEVQNLQGSTMSFIRIRTNELWDMDLKQVHKAYLELSDFKTINFKEYVPRRHSPALGLLLHLKLLVC